MLSLLKATQPYINQFYGIRCSTRPDCINSEILDILQSYGVTAIELGAQSMCDDVLAFNNRGHNADDVICASKMIKERGISLGLQMMTGLYGSTPEKDLKTAEIIADLCPDTVRVYPTIISENTALAELFLNKIYIPYDEETTINTCSDILELFYKRNINVIRVGLHYSDELVKTKVGGYYHPAFREICESRIFLKAVMQELSKYPKGKYDIWVGDKFISKAVGNKKSNIKSLKELGYSIKFCTREDIIDYKFFIEEKK